MLAQSFLSHDTLGISEIERGALVKVLGMLERGEIGSRRTVLDMSSVGDGCGTAGCLIGWSRYVACDRELFDWIWRPEDSRLLPVHDLFLFLCAPAAAKIKNRSKITPSQAATALRSYLTIGAANWAEALAAEASP